MNFARVASAAALALLLAGCASAPPASIASLRLLGSATVARTEAGASRDFGGISGADRDPATGRWLLLSDDRSGRAPARFYEAHIPVESSGLGPIEILGAVSLRRPGGQLFPGVEAGSEVPDPEALRVDPRTGEICWASEGDRSLGLDPFVRWASRDGSHVRELKLPDNLRFHRGREYGARHNLTIEGLSFAPGGESVWVSMEAPLYQDGPVPSPGHGALARMTRVTRSGGVLGQYAYPLDPVPRAGVGGRQRSDNGVSDILALADDRLLVVERSGYEVETMVFRFGVRLYEARVDGASDVAAVESLQGAPVVPMRKRLLLDLDALGIGPIDNIEAVAWGPRLPGGHATLLLVSDDNFSPRQVTQFIALEVMP